MSVRLRVVIPNICVFVLWDAGTEVWIIPDEHHEPRFWTDKDVECIPGYDVRFTSGGREVPTGICQLAGRIESYIRILSVTPEAVLQPGWVPGSSTMLPQNATRVTLPGGILTAAHVPKGDARSWAIADRPPQPLTSQSIFECDIEGPPFVVLRAPKGQPKPMEIPRGPDGVYTAVVGAADITGRSTVNKVEGEVFAIEVHTFGKVFDLPVRGTFPVPHTYWPEYECDESQAPTRTDPFRMDLKATDPCGGPCPSGLLDLRTQPLVRALMTK